MIAARIEIVFEESIYLGDPNSRDAKSWESVTLTEPTGKQLEEAERVSGNWAPLLTLIMLNAKVPRKIVDQMRQRDLQRAADFFTAFGKPDDSTSSESSPQD